MSDSKCENVKLINPALMAAPRCKEEAEWRSKQAERYYKIRNEYEETFKTNPTERTHE